MDRDLMPATRRGRKPTIDATRTWDIAEGLERIVGPGYDLVHTKRMGWMLRRWDSLTGRNWDTSGEPRMDWTELDSAPDGQLGALLLRHQQRERQR